MKNFENDPLAQVHADLADGKTKTHFDEVLKLKGFAQNDFNPTATGDVIVRKTTTRQSQTRIRRNCRPKF